jgi:hypothetical protein
MSNTNLQFENAAQQFLSKNPGLVAKYFSPTLLKTLADAMQSSLPTVTAAKITFDRLVANDSLLRTDGQSEEDDRRENVDRAQANLDKAISTAEAPPLTPSELQYFGSLSQRDLSAKYYGEDGSAINEFAVRYRRACREFGFTIPGRFGDQAVADAREIQLTAAEYHAIPSDVLKVRMRDPKWKAAIYRLIKAGQI